MACLHLAAKGDASVAKPKSSDARSVAMQSTSTVGRRRAALFDASESVAEPQVTEKQISFTKTLTKRGDFVAHQAQVGADRVYPPLTSC